MLYYTVVGMTSKFDGNFFFAPTSRVYKIGWVLFTQQNTFTPDNLVRPVREVGWGEGSLFSFVRQYVNSLCRVTLRQRFTVKVVM